MTKPTDKGDGPKPISDNDLDNLRGAGMFSDIGRALGKAIGGGVRAVGDFAGKAMGGIVGSSSTNDSVANRGGDSSDGISGGDRSG